MARSPDIIDFDVCRVFHEPWGTATDLTALTARVAALETALDTAEATILTLSALLSGTGMQITATGLWLYNAETLKWNFVSCVGALAAEQIQLGAGEDAPA